eukprot:scaffold72916_cov67-Phaeocystis_antarctica.AAC.5
MGCARPGASRLSGRGCRTRSIRRRPGSSRRASRGLARCPTCCRAARRPPTPCRPPRARSRAPPHPRQARSSAPAGPAPKSGAASRARPARAVGDARIRAPRAQSARPSHGVRHPCAGRGGERSLSMSQLRVPHRCWLRPGLVSAPWVCPSVLWAIAVGFSFVSGSRPFASKAGSRGENWAPTLGRQRSASAQKPSALVVGTARARDGGDGIRADRGGVGVLFKRDLADGARAHTRGERAADVHHREVRGADAQRRKRRKGLLLAPEKTPDAFRRVRGARARDGVQCLSGGGGLARNAGRETSQCTWGPRSALGDLGASDRRARL